MKKTFIFYLALIFLSIVLTLSFLYFENIRKTYIHLFKVSTLITHKNDNGKLNGESILYENGKEKIIGTFSNGLKVGPIIRFYDNGIVQNKEYYKNDKPDGKEFEYYDDGKLKFQCFWTKGKRYGDLYYYYDSGQLMAFHTYDILEKKINIIRYDSTGKILKIDGSVFSKNLYSINKKDSLIVLKNGAFYTDIQDLYITVSTPSNFNIQFFVTINNSDINLLTIKDNTLRIPNVFNQNRIYNMTIGGELLDKKNKIVETNILEIKIGKK